MRDDQGGEEWNEAMRGKSEEKIGCWGATGGRASAGNVTVDNTLGIPRMINRLCTTALLVAVSEKRQVPEEYTIR